MDQAWDRSSGFLSEKGAGVSSVTLLEDQWGAQMAMGSVKAQDGPSAPAKDAPKEPTWVMETEGPKMAP